MKGEKGANTIINCKAKGERKLATAPQYFTNIAIIAFIINLL